MFTETGQFVGIVSAKEGEGMGMAISADSVIASLNSVRQSDLRATDKVLNDEISRKVSEKYFAPWNGSPWNTRETTTNSSRRRS